MLLAYSRIKIIFFAEHVKTANNYSLASEADLGYVKQLRRRAKQQFYSEKD